MDKTDVRRLVEAINGVGSAVSTAAFFLFILCWQGCGK